MAETKRQTSSIKILSWPTPQDYNEAVQNSDLSFSDQELKSGQPTLTAHGLPRPFTGAFASVYRVQCKEKDWAVRCFLRNFADQQERYLRISEHLSIADLPYTVRFDFLSEGILLYGRWYPILKMEWTDGQHLNEFIESNLFNRACLEEYAEKWRLMMRRLMECGIAHCDLQHGNVLVCNNDFKLVDYDGMYVPALAGLGSNELGHRNYQHPGRTKDHFGPYLDHFAAWVVYVSLRCVGIDPALWRLLGGGDECLLFCKADFTDPGRSLAFATLEQHQSTEIRQLARILRYLLTLPLSSLPDLDHAPAEPLALPPLGVLPGSTTPNSGPLPAWIDSAQLTTGRAGSQSYRNIHGQAAGSAASGQRQPAGGAVSSAVSTSGRGSAKKSGWKAKLPIVCALIVIASANIYPVILNANHAPPAAEQATQTGVSGSTDSAMEYIKVASIRSSDSSVEKGDRLFARREYKQAAEQYEVAAKLLTEAGYRKFDHNSKETVRRFARINAGIGSCLIHLQDFSKAQSYLLRAVTQAEQGDGHNSLSVALNLSDLGTAEFALKDYRSAGKRFQESLNVMKKLAKPSNQQVATTMRNLALVRQRQKQYAQATPLLRRALQLYERSDATDKSEQIVKLLKDLSFNYQSLGDRRGLATISAKLKASQPQATLGVQAESAKESPF